MAYQLLTLLEKKMVIRTLIFDVGGVLLNTKDWRWRRRWEERLGLPEGKLSAYILESEAAALARIGQISEPELWKHIGVTFGLDSKQLRKLESDFWAGDRLDAEMLQFVQALRSHYKIALLSNAWSGARQAYSRTYKLDSVADVIIISAEQGVAKPDRRIYLIAAEKLDVNPDEILFIDDMAENIQGARDVGMHVVHFENTAQAIVEIRQSLNQYRKT